MFYVHIYSKCKLTVSDCDWIIAVLWPWGG